MLLIIDQLPEVTDAASKLSFETLVSFHKQEGQEAMAYLTVLYTVIIGILGYLGTATRVERSARYLILFFYTGLHLSMITAFFGSMRIHNALHEEIRYFTQANKEVFYNFNEDGIDSLYTVLSGMKGHDLTLMIVAAILMYIIVALCILSIGHNKILHWQRINKSISIRNFRQ